MKEAVLRTVAKVGLLVPAYRGYELARSLGSRGNGSAGVDGLPLPPGRLRQTIAGTADARWFLESGRATAETIREVAAETGRPIDEEESVLDFGCGCGRVLRHWAGLDGPELRGCDYNPALVRWCRRNLPFALVSRNALEPPAPYEPGSFSLVYALSVLTHLPEGLQARWLDDLARVLRPDGRLLFTVHGAAYRDRLAAAERAAFDRGDTVVRWDAAPGTNLCTAFHPPDAVRRLAARRFEVVHFVPQGARGMPEQDVYLLRRRA